MNKKKKVNYLEAIKLFDQIKQISKEEVKEFMEEILAKAFQKDDNAGKPAFVKRDENLKKDENLEEEPEEILYNVQVNFDIETGDVEVKRVFMVEEDFSRTEKKIKIALTDPRIIDKDYKVGDIYEEEIDLSNISILKSQYIKQLLIQKTSELEKLKIYNEFIDRKDTLIKAKVMKVERDYCILDFENNSIFMPRKEMLPNEVLKVGSLVWVYIINVEKSSKNAQIIVSRAHPNFVKKLIEKENVDVQEGVVKIDKIVREAGSKTKISVSSTHQDVDPVGAIIGVKGQKIEPILKQLSGEKIDVIESNDNFEQFLNDAILPAKVRGISYLEEFEVFDFETQENIKKKNVLVIVDENQFLPAIGKNGINIKLTSQLVGAKIDLKTIDDAKEAGIEWTPIKPKENTFKSRKNLNVNDFNFDMNALYEDDDEESIMMQFDEEIEKETYSNLDED